MCVGLGMTKQGQEAVPVCPWGGSGGWTGGWTRVNKLEPMRVRPFETNQI